MKKVNKNNSLKGSLVGIAICLMLITTSLTAVSTTMNEVKEQNNSMNTDREYTDVGVTMINSPPDVTYSGNRTVNATIENYGDTYQDVSVDCSIHHLYLYEDFSGDLFPPFGWVEQELGEWRKSNQCYAGGEPPEARMSGFNADECATLKSDPVNTTNASQLFLEFKHYIDYYAYLVQCKVWTRMNTSDIWTDVTPWSNPLNGNIGPENVVIDISHDIGPETQVMWWYFTGSTWDRSWWCIDDVVIYDPAELIYTSSEIIPVSAYSTALVEFSPPWDAAIGFYNLTVEAFVAGDDNQSNDQLSKIVTVDVPPVYPDLSFLNLTGESALGLTTCSAGDSPIYEYVKVTIIDTLGTPIASKSAEHFSFFAMPGANTTSYFDLNDHLVWIPEDNETDENGEIRFTVQADTSIGADIIAATGDGGYITIGVTVDGVTLNDTEDLLVNSYDIDVDGWVDKGDFNTFQVDFGLNRQRSDYNWDGKVTLSDFNYFAVHYGHRNHPPYIPSNPNPTDGEINISIDANLSWTGGDSDGDTVAYDVYFGINMSPPKMSANQSNTTYTLPGFPDYDTMYYWKIVAWDNHGKSIESPIWTFTTKQLYGWSPTKVISTDSPDISDNPSMAVDDEGTIHVAWEEGGSHDTWIYYKQRPQGGFWSPVEVVASTGYSYNPSLAVDGEGNVHIVWKEDDCCSPYADWINYRQRLSNGSWTPTELVSTESDENSVNPSLAIDLDRNVHIVWCDESDYDDAGNDKDIFYKMKAADGNWTLTEVVSWGWKYYDSYSPSLGVDSDETVHVVYAQDTFDDRDIYYMKKPIGSNWSTVITNQISTESTSDSRNPSLAVDNDGTVHVVWSDPTDYDGSDTDLDIFYKKKTAGGSWTITEVVSTESTNGSGGSSLAIEPDGIVHVAWRDETDYDGSGSDDDIFYKIKPNVGSWTITEVVSTESTRDSQAPSLAVDTDGTVHVAWHDRTDYSGAGDDWDIFYKMRI